MSQSIVNNNITVRRADFDDAKGLNNMVDVCGGVSIFRASFGQYNFASMIESSCLCLVGIELSEKDGSTDVNYSAFLNITDSPSLLGDSQSFSITIEALRPYIPVSENNTMFINFWCLDDRTNEHNTIGTQIITKAFSICNNLDFIVWFCPVSYVTNQFIDRNFSSVTLAEYDAYNQVFKGYKVMFLHRSNFQSKLMVREALVEDNDDLIPILRKFNPDVLVGQENFFLADLIQSQDESNRFFVGLSKRDEIVGMLATSLDVNVSLIMKLFDISAFSDIIIQEDEKPPPPPLVVNIVGDLRLVDASVLEDIVVGFGCVFVSGEGLHREIASQKATTGSFSLSAHLQKLLTQRGREVMAPGAFVVFGYPCSEADAVEQMQSLLHSDLDVVIELSNAAEEEAEDEEEEDAFLQQHLDGLEVLREQYFQLERSSQQGGGVRSKALWHKISMDSELHEKSENIGQLTSELSRILDQRTMRIDEQRARDSERPPMANAFALTVFCLEDAYLSRAEDLLRVAFEDHPHHNYCLFMVPNNKPPSELTQSMTYVKTRPGLSFDQSLYIMHRSYFLAHEHICVRRLTGDSLSRLDDFLGYMREVDRQPLMDSAAAAVAEDDVDLRDNPGEVTFLVHVGSTIVGVVQLSRKILTGEDASWFRANYQLDSLVNFDRHRVRAQAIVTHWVLDPVYSRWARHVLRDIMRMYGKTLLYYHCARDYTPPKEVLEEFVSISPRHRMQQQMTPAGGPTGVIVDLLARPTADAKGNDCPLYCITKQFLLRPKEIVAKRIVVIGGSAHSYAVLETLLSVPYIVFPNVYLVMDRLPAPLRQGGAIMPGGYPQAALDAEESKQQEDEFAGMLSPSDADFPTEQQLFALGLAHKVNLVRGHLTDIDRENRAVVVSDEVAIEYDVLILSSCTQDNTCRRFPTVANMHSAKCADAGIFQLGNPSADLLAVRWIRKRYSPKMDPVVVYGTVIRAFTAVAQLLRSGVAASRVVTVLQDSESFISEIEDSTVADKLVQVIKLMGVRVYWDHAVVDVNLSRTGFVQSVEIKNRSGATQPLETEDGGKEQDVELTDTGNLRVPCVAVLCCNFSTCDRDVFSAVNDSGLVFDGGLVVDASFATVDPCIYAVGDFTRFSRIYKDAVPHIRFNPREVGSYVALKLLAQHPDPTSAKAVQRSRVPTAQGVRAQNGSVDSASFAGLPTGARHSGVSGTHRHQQALPVFTLPRTTYCHLPGDLHYFQSTLPKQPDEANYLSTPPPISLSQSRAAFAAVTEGVSVCSLKTSYLGLVTEFVYLGSAPVEVRNLRHIPGKHEAFLNSAVHAYKKGLVADWVSFFRNEWASVLYHDHCHVLLQSLRDCLKSDKGMVMILSRVFERAENTLENQEVDEYRRGFIGPHGEHVPESTMRTIQAETTSFLKENKATLSQYYLPQQQQQQQSQQPQSQNQ